MQRSKTLRLSAIATAVLLLVSVIPTITSCGDEDGAAVEPSISGSRSTPDSSSSSTPDGEPHEPFVATYFYYWYDLPDGPHSTELTHRPAQRNASYESIDWFKKQLTDMSDAGIDVALAVYWGEAEPSSDIGLANMAAAYDQLQAEGQPTPSIAMFLDTGVIGQWPLPERDLTRPEQQERVYSMIRSFYEILPEHQWMIVDGRPLVWFWAAYFDIKFDGSFFDYVISSFEEDFGVRPYLVGEEIWRLARTDSGVDASEEMPLDDFYIWGAALDGFRFPPGGIAEIGPGYDERALRGPGRSGRHRDRDDGNFYEASFQQAIESGSPVIAIETWNEFHEASDIADSVEFGRQYIDLTRQYVDLFKATHANATLER